MSSFLSLVVICVLSFFAYSIVTGTPARVVLEQLKNTGKELVEVAKATWKKVSK